MFQQSSCWFEEHSRTLDVEFVGLLALADHICFPNTFFKGLNSEILVDYSKTLPLLSIRPFAMIWMNTFANPNLTLMLYFRCNFFPTVWPFSSCWYGNPYCCGTLLWFSQNPYRLFCFCSGIDSHFELKPIALLDTLNIFFTNCMMAGPWVVYVQTDAVSSGIWKLYPKIKTFWASHLSSWYLWYDLLDFSVMSQISWIWIRREK